LNLYHDGLVIGSAPFEEGKRIDLSYLGMGYGGADDPPANGQFYGQLDEVSLFTRALQGEQILAIYNSGTPSYDEIVAEETLKGEDWSVEITPIDREDSGSTVTSNTVTIENTAPTTPSGSTLSPSTLKVGNTLTATGAGSTDADGDSLTYYYEFRSNSASGTILQAYSTTNTYTVAQSDSGTTIYVNIKANDATDDSSAETVSKAVSNTAPTIAGTDITINGQEDTDLIFGTVNFTTSASYSDADGDAFAGIRITSAPTNGDLFNGATQLTGTGLQCNTIVLGGCSAYNLFVSSSDIASGNFKFVPDSNVNGNTVAAFGFNVYDGAEYSSGIGTSIVINLGSVNDAPVAVDDEYSLDSGNTLSVSASGVLTNDSDVDGDSLTTVLGVPPSGASSFTLNSDGSFTYVSDPTYSGATDSFTYRANDGSLNSNVANVTINLAKTISIALSNSLSTALTFSASQANAQFSGSGNDDYHVNLTANGTAANLSIKASGPLSDGGSNSIALSNFKYNYTGSSTPVALSTSETNTTKSFAGILKQTFFEFFIDVPASQSSGTYTNTITFRGETL
ncbi:MAG: Ig-like domain-containing protein, partial [Candidatus Woesearchaeota archaeon]